MVQKVGTNNFATAKWIVAPTLTEGATHTTIAGAMTSASSGDLIVVRPGTYTENLTAKAGVHLSAHTTDKLTPIIVGKISCDMAAGSICEFAGFRIQTNGDYAVSFTGANENYLTFTDCAIDGINNDIIQFTNSSGSSILNLINCAVSPAGNYKCFVASQAGYLIFRHGQHPNASETSTNATISSGTLRLEFTEVRWGITTSGTAIVEARHSYFRCGEINITPLTLGGNPSFVNNCVIMSGTATAIVCTGTLTISGTSISSTNAATISGAGTIYYCGLDYFNSSKDITVTTKTARWCDVGSYQAQGQPAFLAYASALSNVTGDATYYTVVFANEVFDQAANFDGTSTFTAPVTGRYLISATLQVTGITDGMSENSVDLVTSNRTYRTGFYRPAGLNITSQPQVHAILCDMDAGDTAVMKIVCVGGAKVVDLDATNSFFSAYLAC